MKRKENLLLYLILSRSNTNRYELLTANFSVFRVNLNDEHDKTAANKTRGQSNRIMMSWLSSTGSIRAGDFRQHGGEIPSFNKEVQALGSHPKDTSIVWKC
ncbi:hypothetical protein OnM2_106016 [Erysiphe neolycopersici]|uniref:Uncharacterized protein n=1 Tax=Erysiphe neolycopersici TaxID=212602 RepID=A0A420H7D8_9PEZI|nr:hypothetical protein OnM2_106016 [Erysiphe neolycopersici]